MELKFITEILRNFLLENGSYSYLANGKNGAAEATCWVTLFNSISGLSGDITEKSVAWLKALQSDDGSVKTSEISSRMPVWATSQFLFVMQYLGETEAAGKAADFIINFKPLTFERFEEVEQDNSIPGMSWTKNAFSWVEPTAWALIALKKAGYKDHPRVAQLNSLLADRLIPEKGWNLGNRMVFSAELLPFFDTTAISLIATFTGKIADEKKLIYDLMGEQVLKTESIYALAVVALCLKQAGIDFTLQKNKLINLVRATNIKYLNSFHLGLAGLAISEKEVF